jgi:phosphoserine aminotransferase
MAMWTMLGQRPVTVLAWESFGEGWVTDAVKQLRLDPNVIRADYGELPDLAQVDWSSDVLFTWNGTTSGVRVPDTDWIPDDREGLSFADATSAVFAYPIDWTKVDVATFSWQKALGGEGAHGVLILGPRAVERLESFTPDRPLPKLFRLTKAGKLNKGIFRGETINTPSMLAVEDAIFALEWAKGVGGLSGLIARTEANAAALDRVVQDRDWLGYLAKDAATRSKTSVCLTVEGADAKAMAKLLEAEGAAYDIVAYRDAPTGLRIWCGATVDSEDIEAIGPWLDWAFESTLSPSGEREEPRSGEGRGA